VGDGSGDLGDGGEDYERYYNAYRILRRYLAGGILLGEEAMIREYLIEYDIPSTSTNRVKLYRYIKRLREKLELDVDRSTESTILCESLDVARDIVSLIRSLGGEANIWKVHPIDIQLLKLKQEKTPII
jgi:hypothetical protein